MLTRLTDLLVTVNWLVAGLLLLILAVDSAMSSPDRFACLVVGVTNIFNASITLYNNITHC